MTGQPLPQQRGQQQGEQQQGATDPASASPPPGTANFSPPSKLASRLHATFEIRLQQPETRRGGGGGRRGGEAGQRLRQGARALAAWAAGLVGAGEPRGAAATGGGGGMKRSLSEPAMTTGRPPTLVAIYSFK